MVRAGDFSPDGCTVGANPDGGDRNNLVKWREYFGSHLFAAKIPGTLAVIKNQNVSSNCRWSQAHN